MKTGLVAADDMSPLKFTVKRTVHDLGIHPVGVHDMGVHDGGVIGMRMSRVDVRSMDMHRMHALCGFIGMDVLGVVVYIT
jgi:hypothetical protein